MVQACRPRHFLWRKFQQIFLDPPCAWQQGGREGAAATPGKPPGAGPSAAEGGGALEGWPCSCFGSAEPKLVPCSSRSASTESHGANHHTRSANICTHMKRGRYCSLSARSSPCIHHGAVRCHNLYMLVHLSPGPTSSIHSPSSSAFPPWASPHPSTRSFFRLVFVPVNHSAGNKCGCCNEGVGNSRSYFSRRLAL
jgi:hypothetical protein